MLALSRHSSPGGGVALQVLGSLVPVADAQWLLGRFAAHQEVTSTTDASQGPSGLGNQTSAADGTHEAAVVDELFAYFYFCATVLEIFTDELSEEAFLRLARGCAGSKAELTYSSHATPAALPAAQRSQSVSDRVPRAGGLRCPSPKSPPRR